MRKSVLPSLLMATHLVCIVGGIRAGEKTLAKDVLRRCGVSGGLLVHLGCGDGRLTAALRSNERCVVHGLDSDPERIAAARRHITSLGIYGPVSVMQWDRPYLPYRDNMVDLVFCEDPGDVDAEEIMRVLAPLGTAYVKRGSQWKQTVKPWPEDIGEWTHWLQDAGNNPVARDTRVGPPNHMQWKCGPLWARAEGDWPSSS